MIKLTKQFIKFCIVGFTNLAVQLFFYFIFTRIFHFHYLIATILAFFFAVTWSFFINKKWTFRDDGQNHRQQYIRFFIANVIAFFFNVSLLSFFIEFFGIYDILSQFLASVASAFVNFGLNRFWTFRKKEEID